MSAEAGPQKRRSCLIVWATDKAIFSSSDPEFINKAKAAAKVIAERSLAYSRTLPCAEAVAVPAKPEMSQLTLDELLGNK